MSEPIEISPDAAARLEAAARREATTVDIIAERLLRVLPRRAGWAALSQSEARVAALVALVALVALGAMRGDIAAELGLAEATVDACRGRALRKLGLRTSVALTRYAIRIGVVGTEESEYEVGRPSAGGPRAGRIR